MKTAEEREADFRREFAALLEKHGAELDITDDGKPHGLHNGIARVSMASIWDRDADKLLADYAEFNL